MPTGTSFTSSRSKSTNELTHAVRSHLQRFLHAFTTSTRRKTQHVTRGQHDRDGQDAKLQNVCPLASCPAPPPQRNADSRQSSQSSLVSGSLLHSRNQTSVLNPRSLAELPRRAHLIRHPSEDSLRFPEDNTAPDRALETPSRQRPATDGTLLNVSLHRHVSGPALLQPRSLSATCSCSLCGR